MIKLRKSFIQLAMTTMVSLRGCDASCGGHVYETSRGSCNCSSLYKEAGG